MAQEAGQDELKKLFDTEKEVAMRIYRTEEVGEGDIDKLMETYRAEIDILNQLEPENEIEETLLGTSEDLFKARNRMYNPETREKYLDD